jgi:hypothetical protein
VEILDENQDVVGPHHDQPETVPSRLQTPRRGGLLRQEGCDIKELSFGFLHTSPECEM